MRLLVIAAALIATACSHHEEDVVETPNLRVVGTVVSVKRTSDYNSEGAKNAAESGVGAVTGKIVNTLTLGIFSDVATPKKVKKGDLQEIEGRVYVVKTDNGQLVKVAVQSDRIFYPGEEVIVVSNSEGYQAIYPRDLSGPHPGGY